MAHVPTQARTLTSTTETTRTLRPRRFRWFNTFLYAVLAIFTLTSIGPFIFSFFSSFKTFSHILDFPPMLLPNPVTWDNYQQLLQYPGFPSWIINSFIYGAGTTILNVSFSAMAGYALSRLHFRGREA